MSTLCPILRGSFGDYRRDALPAPQRRILRDHLAVCAECRALAAAEDSTMLFARSFAAEALPEDESRQILDNVRTAVTFAQTERRIRRTSRRRIASAAAAAAAFGALLLMAPGGGTDRVDTQVAAIEEADEAAPAPTAADADRSSPSEVSASFAALPSLVQPAALETEGVSNDATVYEWSPGAGREEPRVVWIVDRGLDI